MPALAGGCDWLAISCDLIVAAENAKFGIPEVKRGLVAAAGGLVIPRRSFNWRRDCPRRFLTGSPWNSPCGRTGEFMGADRAMAMGLINQLTEAGSALATAKALAQQIAENGPMAVKVSKAIIKASRDWGEDEAWSKQACPDSAGL